MSIKEMNELGFTVISQTKDGEFIGEATFTWADAGVVDEAALEPMARWAIGNGFSQAFTDAQAGKSLDDRRKAFASKLDRFRRGVVPSLDGARGPAKSRLELALSAVCEAWLRKRGEKATKAKELAKAPADVAADLAAKLATKTGRPAEEFYQKLYNSWTEAATKRLADEDALEIDLEA